MLAHVAVSAAEAIRQAFLEGEAAPSCCGVGVWPLSLAGLPGAEVGPQSILHVRGCLPLLHLLPSKPLVSEPSPGTVSGDGGLGAHRVINFDLQKLY